MTTPPEKPPRVEHLAPSRPGPASGWYRPASVRLVDGRIFWTNVHPATTPKGKDKQTAFATAGGGSFGGGELLHDFLALAKASEQDALSFLARRGELDLCQHGNLPFHHFGEDPCRPAGEYDGAPFVAVEDIRRIAEGFAALYRVSQCLREPSAGPASPRNWRPIFEAFGSRWANWAGLLRTLPEDAPWPEPSLGMMGLSFDLFQQRVELSHQVSHVLRIAGVRPMMAWWPEAKRPYLKTEPTTVLGAIALDLAIAVMGAPDQALPICVNCEREYGPLGRPLLPHERPYCHRPECKKARAAENSRRYRRHKKEQRNG